MSQEQGTQQIKLQHEWRKLLIWGSAFALCVLFNVAWIEVASAATYYVAPTGQDSHPGTLAQPLRTISAAITKVGAGDTIYVRGGVYNEVVALKKSGAPGQPIRLLAYSGERPVIDGRYTLPSGRPERCDNSVNPPRCFVGPALVKLGGSYLEFSGFKIMQSQGAAIDIGGNSPVRDIRISNCQIHEIRNAAIRGRGITNLTVEGCDVYHAGNYAPYDRSGSQLKWPPIVKVMASTNLTYRNNTIHENWGEGLAAGVDSSNVIIEDNIIYNNFAVQLYVNRAQNVTIQRNLIYHTNDPTFRRGGDPSQCISLNNEAETGASLSTKTIQIVNNVLVGCSRHIAFWAGESTNLSIEAVTIQNNTLVNAHSNFADKAYSLTISNKVKTRNVRIERNIILQSSQNIGSVPANIAIFAANLWSRTPPTNLQGAGDIVADPKLANPNAVLRPGQVSIDWFKPLPSSPAIGSNMGPREYLRPFATPTAADALTDTIAVTGESAPPIDDPLIAAPDEVAESDPDVDAFTDDLFSNDLLPDEALSDADLTNSTGGESGVAALPAADPNQPNRLYLPLISQDASPE